MDAQELHNRVKEAVKTLPVRFNSKDIDGLLNQAQIRGIKRSYQQSLQQNSSLLNFMNGFRGLVHTTNPLPCFKRRESPVDGFIVDSIALPFDYLFPISATALQIKSTDGQDFVLQNADQLYSNPFINETQYVIQITTSVSIAALTTASVTLDKIFKKGRKVPRLLQSDISRQDGSVDNTLNIETDSNGLTAGTHVVIISPKDLFNQDIRDKTYKIDKLLTPFAFDKRIFSTTAVTKKRSHVSIKQQDDIYSSLSNPFSRPKFERPVGVFDSDFLDIFSKDSFITDNIIVTYVRMPNFIMYRKGFMINPEIPEDRHDELLQEALSLINIPNRETSSNNNNSNNNSNIAS